MAAVLPMWTNMIVYYVEESEGHMMNEEIGRARYRRAVKGQSFSFAMPWRDLIAEFQRREAEDELLELPRKLAVLQYVFRLHLKVAGDDFTNDLRHVRLRPHVWLQLNTVMARAATPGQLPSDGD